MQRQLVLASASPRREKLLHQLGITPDSILAPEIDETPLARELPRVYAARMAREKANAARLAAPDDTYILAGDTVVAVGRRIMPKAEDADTARACLSLFSGRRHRVFSSVALLTPNGQLRERISQTIVRFKPLSGKEINDYIASNEWHGKAGGYAIQGQAEGLITWVSGSYSGVVGLPLFDVRGLLLAEGFTVG